MARIHAVGFIGALLLLAGCAGTDIDAMRDASGSGSAFSRALTEEYRQITVFEADEMYDWRDADHFARKGLRAAGGEEVLPEEIGAWDLPADHVGELTSARARLVALLDGNARINAPQEAGHAQGRFDCWIEQQEENHQPDHIAACRDEFFAALDKLEMAMAPPEPAPVAEPMMETPTSFTVFFDFESWILSPEAEAVIGDAYAAANKKGTAAYSVTGHTDTFGPTDYNDYLSTNRAMAVKEALMLLGVSEDIVSVAGRGESEPAVPTGDQVKEQANRRAVILLQ